MMPVIFSIDNADQTLLDSMLANTTLAAKSIKRDRIIGGAELATILITLTPVVLHALIKLFREKWARNAKVSIEARGVKIEGASPDDIEKILKQILEHDAPAP